MYKLSLLTLIALLGICIFPFHSRAANTDSAALPGSFAFTYNGTVYKVPAATVSGWRGLVSMTDSTPLKKAVDVTTTLLTSVGINTQSAQVPQYYTYRPDAIYSYLSDLSAQINIPSQEPALTIENGRVTNFTEPQTGLTLNIHDSTLQAIKDLEHTSTSSELSVQTQNPKQSLGSLNNLGITQLIAQGKSTFNGSPNNRRINIAVGIQKFSGLLIAPGEEFSFDDNLGPVTAEAGFTPELVISNGSTHPELGGGLCQVSTTMFRAAMQAGLPITDRRNHAYAVSYYAPQGTDATIYPGSADLKFINDTPAYILVWPHEVDKNTLYFDFWGTSDNRQVTLETPVVYDRKADGSMKATWTREITKNGTTTTSTFKSTYQPPALFHKTEAYVSTATPPTELHVGTN